MNVWHSLRGALPWLIVPASWVMACGGTTRNGGETSEAGSAAGGALNRGGASSMQPVDTSGTRAAGGMSTTGGMGAMPGAGAPGITVPGTSDHSTTLKCGAQLCKSVKTIVPGPLYVDPCCAGDTGDACGVDTQFFAIIGTSFKDTCQAVGQEGSLDAACPDSPDQLLKAQGQTFSVPGFAGCCRADTGTCGVVVDSIQVAGIPLPFASPMLGCADSAPFFGGKPAATCGAAGAGTGGVGGADSSPAGAPGAGAAGGAGGAG